MLRNVTKVLKVRDCNLSLKFIFEPLKHFMFFVQISRRLLVYLDVLVFSFIAYMAIHVEH